jgi:hypothetical protein
VAADLNGDGKPDLAVASEGSKTVSVLLGNGDDTFSSPAYATGKVPTSVAAADLNGDGKPDLAVASQGGAADGTVSVLLNKGNGTFAAKVDYATGSSAEAVAAADLNGDGKPDLAVANQVSQSVSVLLNACLP